MENVDFYVLPASDPEARTLFLCRLCERVLDSGSRIHIHCPDENTVEHLDRLLWEHKAEAFLPHRRIGQDDISAPITLGWGDQRPEQRDVFVNMALEIPADALEFPRILEIVVQTPDVLSATRANFRQYRDGGVTPRMHDMRR